MKLTYSNDALFTNRIVNHFISRVVNQNDKVQFLPSHVGHGQK